MIWEISRKTECPGMRDSEILVLASSSPKIALATVVLVKPYHGHIGSLNDGAKNESCSCPSSAFSELFTLRHIKSFTCLSQMAGLSDPWVTSRSNSVWFSIKLGFIRCWIFSYCYKFDFSKMLYIWPCSNEEKCSVQKILYSEVTQSEFPVIKWHSFQIPIDFQA